MSLFEARRALAALRRAAPPHRVFAIFGLLAVLATIVATPPFMNPDETQHYKRTYSVAKGELIATVRNGRPGVEAPLSLAELNDSFFYPNRVPPMRLTDTIKEFQRPLDPQRTSFLPLRPDAVYSPLAYAPQALAMAVGRSFGAGPLLLLYLAHIGNALACVALIASALRVMKSGREAGMLIALLPMSLAMMASSSPDGISLSGGMLYVAFLSRCLADGRWSAGRLAAIGLSGALMCAAKVVYVPALGAGAVYLLGRAPWPERLRVVGVQALMALAVAGFSVWWLRQVDASNIIGAREGVDAARQLQQVLADPAGFLGLTVHSMIVGAGYLIRTALGVFGWTDIFMPKAAYAVLLLAALLSLLASRDPPALSPLACLWITLLLGVTALLIEFGLYLVWTPVGQPLIEGVQGRYFLPVLPLGAFMLTSLAAPLRRLVNPDLCYAGLLAGIVLSTAAMGYTLVRAFGIFHA